MKKVLALVMVLAMMLSLSVMAFADGPEPSATTDTGFAQNQGQTEFKMTITADDSEKEPTYTEIDTGTDASGNYYEAITAVTSSQSVSVTVPLYVTMVGYANGAVSTPDETAYKLTNESTYTKTTEVTGINRYWATKTAAEVFADIKASNSEYAGFTSYSDLAKVTNKFNGVALSVLAGQLAQEGYVYYYDGDDNNKVTQVAEKSCKTINGGLYFLDNLDKDNKEITSYTKADGVTVVNKGDKDETNATKSALSVAVSALKVQQTGSWKLVSDTPSALGEINISINNQNLAPAVNNTLDISGSGWQVEGTLTADGKWTNNTLGLPISAAIAAGNTAATEAAVMTVTYTITPGAEA